MGSKQNRPSKKCRTYEMNYHLCNWILSQEEQVSGTDEILDEKILEISKYDLRD